MNGKVKAKEYNKNKKKKAARTSMKLLQKNFEEKRTKKNTKEIETKICLEKIN